MTGKMKNRPRSPAMVKGNYTGHDFRKPNLVSLILSLPKGP